MNTKFYPRMIKEELDKLVIGQNNVKNALSTVMTRQSLKWNHLILNDEQKESDRLLIIGNTGTGKTFLLQQLNKIFNNELNIMWVNSSEFTGTAWQGKGINLIISDLKTKLIEAVSIARVLKFRIELEYNSDLKLNNIEYSISQITEIMKQSLYKTIFVFDEFDKISTFTRKQQGGEDKTDFQYDLLKFIEDYKIELKYEENFYEFNLKDCVMLFLGAFSGLEKIRFHQVCNYGFNAELKQQEENTIQQSLLEYGFAHELVGRLTYITQMEVLTEKDLLLIIKSSNYIKQIKEEFEIFNVTLDITDEFYNQVLEKTKNSKEGARSILPVLKTFFQKIYENIDSYSYSTIKLESLDFNLTTCIKSF